MFSFVNNKIRGEIWFRMNCTHILLRFSNPIVCTRRGERGRKRRRIRLQVRAKRIARVDHFDNFINWLTSTTNLLHFVQFKSTLIAWSVAISMILLLSLSLSFDHLIIWSSDHLIQNHPKFTEAFGRANSCYSSASLSEVVVIFQLTLSYSMNRKVVVLILIGLLFTLTMWHDIKAVTRPTTQHHELAYSIRNRLRYSKCDKTNVCWKCYTLTHNNWIEGHEQELDHDHD